MQKELGTLITHPGSTLTHSALRLRHQRRLDADPAVVQVPQLHHQLHAPRLPIRVRRPRAHLKLQWPVALRQPHADRELVRKRRPRRHAEQLAQPPQVCLPCPFPPPPSRTPPPPPWNASVACRRSGATYAPAIEKSDSSAASVPANSPSPG